MPIHDWSHVPAGLFHHFHQHWAVTLCTSLNAGGLPGGYYALIEQNSAGVVPDVVTLERGPRSRRRPDGLGGIAVAAAPPKTRFVSQATEEDIYAARANRVAIRNAAGEVVAVIELVSPGNKNSRHAIRAFVGKTVDLLGQGIHLLILDLFPPGPRDPQGIHKLIWDEIHEEPFELPADKRLTLAAYSAGVPKRAYVEPVAVGDALPDMPVFLESETYVPASLEASYSSTWNECPEEFREMVSAPEQ